MRRYRELILAVAGNGLILTGSLMMACPPNDSPELTCDQKCKQMTALAGGNWKKAEWKNGQCVGDTGVAVIMQCEDK